MFGKNVWVEFNGAGTPTSTASSSILTNEGCSSISDPSGNLLFYTDGSTVYDASHGTMPNGTGLGGHSSATQSAIILPSPIDPDIYIIFVADVQCGNGVQNGIQMAYVDMSLLGGLGDVISKNIPVLPGNQATEKMSATCHTNGSDYWLVTQRRGSGDIYAWQVDGLTLTGPVISPGPGNVTTCDSRVGELKISPDGTRLAVMNRQGTSGTAHLYDFDASTGLASNPRTIRSSVTYGCEFSPNSDLLYVTTFGKLFQYDATAATTPVLQASEFQVHQITGGWQMGSIQTGPNGRLYVANGTTSNVGTAIDEIQNPDVAGAGCNFQDNAVALFGATRCGLGLPNFAACVIASQPCDLGNSAQIFPNQLSACTWQFNFGISGGPPGPGTQIVSHHWDFGDGTTSNEMSPTHFYATPGSYTVCYTVTGFNGLECCTEKVCLDRLNVGECDPCEEMAPGFSYFNQGGHLLNFTANTSFGGTGIYWDFGDGSTGTGKNITHQFPGDGNYNVCVTEVYTDYEKGICCTRTYCQLVKLGGGLPDKTANPAETAPLEPGTGSEVGFEVYPNPTQAEATVAFRMDHAGPAEVTLLDAQGRTVHTINPGSVMSRGQYKLRFGTENLPAGLYFVNLKTDHGNYTQRISVMK